MHSHLKTAAAIISVILLTASCSNTGTSEPSKSADSSKAGSIRWHSLSGGLAKAEEVKKPALIFFYTDWCIYCKKMDNEVFADPEVAAYLSENFINIRVNPEKDKEKIKIMGQDVTAFQLLSYMGAKGFPSTAFWDKNQKPVTNFPGYIEKKIFLPLVRYMNTECYSKNVKLEDFLQDNKKCSIN